MHPTGNLKLLDVLLERGAIKPDQRESARAYQARNGCRVEEALFDINAIDEATLLPIIAGMYRTRFVSTEKLAKAEIDRHTLERIPRRLADLRGVFPIIWDLKSETLSIVTADPADTDALHDVQLGSSAKKIHAFVARPAAIRAAINKHYGGDQHAFVALDRRAHVDFNATIDIFERNVVSPDAKPRAEPKPAPPPEKKDPPRAPKQPSAPSLPAPPVSRAEAPKKGATSGEAYLATLNVLVTLLENQRPDLRGHSSHAARLMKKVAERIGVKPEENVAFQIAAYCHDVGKMSAYHLTALNVSEYEGHKTSATRGYKAPLRLLEAAELPAEAKAALESMYERHDGKGLPSGISGKDIPLGARLLAIVDTYADLTQNPKNPYRKSLRPLEACQVLAKYKGSVFDPNLVDLFEHTVTGDDLKERLLATRHLALLVDQDPEETTVLELRMVEQGFEVKIARTPEQAMKILEEGDVEIVVSEMDLPPGDGLALLTEARKKPFGAKLPWVFVTGRAGSADAKRAFDLGAADYMTKPVATDVLAAKLKQIIEREERVSAPRGVGGSLSEMGIPEIVQVLWHGRKTGALKIRGGGESGEIHFVEGAIYDALWGKERGAPAVYAMLTLTSGDFSLDPTFKAQKQLMHESPEALLLEGMRRLDEGDRSRGSAGGPAVDDEGGAWDGEGF